MRRANTASKIIVWAMSLSIALIITTWLAGTINPLREAEAVVTSDLQRVQSLIGHACTSQQFKATFNPETESGRLNATRTSICINASVHRCVATPCQLNPALLQLDNRSTITITTGETRVDLT